MFGAFLPLGSQALFKNLGYQWAGSLLGFLALALSVVPVVLLIKGEYLRAKSPFMASSSFEPGGDDSSPEKQEGSREEA